MNTAARAPVPAGLDSTGPGRAGTGGRADRHHFFQATSTAQASPAHPASTVTGSE